MVLNDKGRIESMQINAMAPTSVNYDSQGSAESISIGSRSYQMAYDGNGFLTAVTDPLGGETDLIRDAAGRILTKTCRITGRSALAMMTTATLRLLHRRANRLIHLTTHRWTAWAAMIRPTSAVSVRMSPLSNTIWMAR